MLRETLLCRRPLDAQAELLKPLLLLVVSECCVQLVQPRQAAYVALDPRGPRGPAARGDYRDTRVPPVTPRYRPAPAAIEHEAYSLCD